jgi:hypothetical protein
VRQISYSSSLYIVAYGPGIDELNEKPHHDQERGWNQGDPHEDEDHQQ